MALATPMLVSLGHDPLMSLVTVVGLNGLSAHLGEYLREMGRGMQECMHGGGGDCTLVLSNLLGRLQAGCAVGLAPGGALGWGTLSVTRPLGGGCLSSTACLLHMAQLCIGGVNVRCGGIGKAWRVPPPSAIQAVPLHSYDQLTQSAAATPFTGYYCWLCCPVSMAVCYGF
jgi:hypothetical protein